MKIGIKKFISLFLALVLILSLASMSFAEGTQTKVSKKSKTTVSALNYARASTTISPENGSLSFQRNYWAEYDVLCDEEVEVDVEVSSGAPHDRNLAVSVNGTKLGNVNPIPTSSYTDLAEDNAGRVKLNAGLNTIRITNAGSACYFNSVILIPVGMQSQSQAVKTGPYRVFDLPTIIEAEEYDYGNNGSYSIDDKNNGKQIRQGAINIYEKEGRTGYYISLEKGEYVKYTFNSKKSGPYTMFVKGNGAFTDVYIDDLSKPLLKEALIDANYNEKELLSVYLSEGEHTLMVKSSGGIAEYDYFRFATCFGDYIMMDDVKEPEKSVYKEFYVSGHGDDKNSGSKEEPFKTISKAKEEVKKISDKMTGDIIVNIAPGYYQLYETEVFDETHSGKNGYSVIYKGEDEENPSLISGGKRVEGWEKVSDYLWKAPLDTETAVRNLYVNGYPAVRARSKYSYIHMGDYDILGDEYTPNGFKTSAVNFPTQIVGEQGLETVWNSEWTAQRALVLDTELKDGMVYFNMEPTFWVKRNTSTYLNAGNIFYIENSFKLLDEPGEFYYNKDEKCIYYYPYNEEDMTKADTYIAELEGLIKIDGKDIDNKVENITFQNLDFRYGVWDNVSKYGLRARQSDMLGLVGGNETEVIPSQISLNRTNNVNFIDSRFSCLGSVGMSLEDAVENTMIKGNIFRDISATGLLIGLQEHYIVAEGSEMCKNIDVENNVFRRCASEYHGSHNIMIIYERNINITHNALMDVPYSNISAGWGWGSSNSKTCGEYNITYNQIFNSMMILKDGGPIYTLGANLNSRIANNHFKGVGKGGEGYGAVYNDQGSQYFTTENNVVEEMPNMWFVNTGSTNLTARNNYITGKEANNRAYDLPNVTVENTTIVKDNDWPDEAVKIMEEAGLEKEYSHLLALSEVPDFRKANFEIIPKNVFAGNEGWIEAEDFMEGGQGVGYYKVKDNPNNNPYRPDGVNLAGKVTNDGWFIHNNGSGDWMKYEIEVEEDGVYELYLKAAQGWAETQPQPGLQISVDDKIVIEDFLIPKTVSWNLFENFNAGKIELTKGKHVLKAEIMHNGLYFDALRIVPEGTDLLTLSDSNFDDGKVVYQNKEEKGFKDIKGHWAEEAVNKMTEKGFVKGYDENTFAPDENVTLFQAIWLSMRVMNLSYSEESWQEDAKAYGIITQDLDKDEEISRQEFISLIVKAYSVKKETLEKSEDFFADDSEINALYKDAVYIAKGLGFIQGDEKGNFNPHKALSRAEAVTVLYNILK